MKKLSWYVKQILPLQYVSEYREDNERYLSIWRMWFGKCFKIKRYKLSGE